MEAKDKKKALEQADVVRHVDPENMPADIGGMLIRIAPTMLRTFGFYGYRCENQKILLISAREIST